MPDDDQPTDLTSPRPAVPDVVKKKAPTTYIGSVVGGRYRIVGPIGRGGAGNVYRGMQEQLGREVAVKILRPDLSDDSKVEWQARFLREAALAGRLSHPNVITVHDYGVTDDGASFVVMEYVRGAVLADLIAKGKVLDPARAANLVCQVARGLRAAHEAELIHRDVKPHNVMVVEEDGRERAILLDFGLVKVADMVDSDLDSYQTRAGTYMGTPAYMAPEQAKGGKVDHRVDLYALGCMLYRLLTGEVPFTAEHPLGMAVQHMTEPVPFFKDVVPELELPPRLEKITRRLMEKDPNHRYRTAADVVSELEKFLVDPPLPKAPPPAVGGALGAGVGAVGASLGLAGIAVASFCILVALVVVLLFAQSGSGRMEPSGTVEPAVLVPLAAIDPEPAAVGTAPEPIQPTPKPAVQPTGPRTPKPPMPTPVPAEPDPVSPVTPLDPAASNSLALPGLPAPGTVPAPVTPVPAPVTLPKDPTPSSAPTSGDVVIDEVGFSHAEAAKALVFVNTASPEQLAAAGVYTKGVEIIVGGRPFASLEAFGGTYGIGKKTVQSVREAAR